ncbi:MAG TPA: STAS domain-containing protein [Solirubrobacterales bacterium]
MIDQLIARGRPQPFQLEETIIHGERELRVIGELDLATSGQLREAIDDRTGDADDVLIDLADCEFMDASGLGVMAHARLRLAGSDRSLSTRSATGQPMRLLALTGQ